MKENEIIDFNEMITKVFSNIETGNLQNANKITSIWKEVTKGIKNTRDEYYGEKISAHSEVVDLKNGQLLIETDHPGWIQVIQLHSKFIIKGMNMKLGNVKVSSLVFRLKGNDTGLYESYEESLERAKKGMEQKYASDEKVLNDYYKKASEKGDAKTESKFDSLPPELMAKLSSLEQTVLTNSKK